MKEEGNDSFKDKDYSLAYDLYSSAIIIGNCIFEQTHDPTVNNQLMAAILCNRATCLLKMVTYVSSFLNIFSQITSLFIIYHNQGIQALLYECRLTFIFE